MKASVVSTYLERMEFSIDLNPSTFHGPEEYTKEDILQLSHAIKEYSRRSSTIDVISRVVSVLLSEDSVLLDSINQIIEKTPNEYAYIGMYPEYAMITITLVPADRTDIDIKIENIPKEKFAEILT